jgi:hypothetical protein
VVLTIDSYNDGEFDPSVPHDEPDNPEPPPTEEDRQLTSRAPGSESAVIDAAQQRNNPTARSQRAAERAEATNARRSPESTSPAPAASAPASTDATAAARHSPRPAEPPTAPMETDEPHAASPPAATTSDEAGGEGAGEGAAAISGEGGTTVPEEDVTESDLFSEDGEQEEGGGALSSPLTQALTPNPRL